VRIDETDCRPRAPTRRARAQAYADAEIAYNERRRQKDSDPPCDIEILARASHDKARGLPSRRSTMSHSMSWRARLRRTDSLLRPEAGRSERAQRLLDSKRMPGLDGQRAESPSWPNVHARAAGSPGLLLPPKVRCGAVSQKLRALVADCAKAFCDAGVRDYEDAIARLEAQMVRMTLRTYEHSTACARRFFEAGELYAFDSNKEGSTRRRACSRRRRGAPLPRYSLR